MFLSAGRLGKGSVTEPGVKVEPMVVAENIERWLSEARGLTLLGLQDFLGGAASLKQEYQQSS